MITCLNKPNNTIIQIYSESCLLDYYQVELQHLTPNGIQHIAAFIDLCEGFLGIDPHFDLWRHLFAVNPLKKRVGKQELHAPVGCTGIHLRNNRV